jgi:hypothetical protein
MSVKPERLLLVEVYLKTHKNRPILKKVFLIGNIICTRNVKQCAYICTLFKLLNTSIISPQGKTTDLIQFSPQLASAYQTFWVSTGLVWYLRKSPAPKFGLLDPRSAKRGSVKSRGYCKNTFLISCKVALVPISYSNIFYLIMQCLSLKVDSCFAGNSINVSMKAHHLMTSWATWIQCASSHEVTLNHVQAIRGKY